MPEEQSVHAREGVADPQGCGPPLRSGVAGLSAAPGSKRFPPLKTSQIRPPEATPEPSEKDPLCPKSKASTPGKAWPIRRDAGFLCDRASRAFRQHPTQSARLTAPQIPPEATPEPNEKARYARRAKRPRQGRRGRSAGMRASFAIGHGGPFGSTRLKAITPSPKVQAKKTAGRVSPDLPFLQRP